MARGKQPAADGRLAYRVNRAGELARIGPDDAAGGSVELEGRYIVATLRGDSLDVRVGATALIDGERRVNREFPLTDEDSTDDLRALMEDLLVDAGAHVEHAVIRDAQDAAREGGR